MERLSVLRFLKLILLLGLGALLCALAWTRFASSWVCAVVVVLPLVLLGWLFHILESWIIDLLHTHERSEQLSNQLQEATLKVTEKNDLLSAKINELTTLRRVTLAMISTMDLDAVLRVILEAVTQELKYDHAEFYLLDEGKTQFVRRLAMGSRGTDGNSTGHPLMASILKEKRPRIVHEEGQDVAMIPILSKDEVVGLLAVDHRTSKKSLHEEDLRTLSTFTHQAGMAVENARLYQTEKRFNEELTRQVELAKEKLLEAHRQLVQSERLAAMGETAAIVAHEIKNPLGSIHMAAQMMVRGLSTDDKRHRYLQLLLKEVDRLNRLANSLLIYAKPLEAQPEKLDANTVIRETLEIVQAELRENEIDVKLSLPEALPDIEADKEHVQQILMNIIQNALFFMKKRPEKKLSIQTRALEKRIQISMADTGGGISPEALPRIFDPFFTTRSQGTGLGLAICKRLIEAHGGSIEVENHPTVGATFRLFFPYRFPKQELHILD